MLLQNNNFHLVEGKLRNFNPLTSTKSLKAFLYIFIH